MSAEESLREGNLEQALAQLQDRVRKNPADAKPRVFLFQLLSVLGQWERALTQLNVAGELDPGTLAMVQAYREAIQCEALRTRVFAGERSPLVFGEPEQWLALLMEALRLTALGQFAQAQQLRDQAFADAPATSGRITTAGEEAQAQAFEWMADADMRLGPVLEAFVNGRYYWIPLHRIREIVVEPPVDLRDVVWMPAHFVWANGGEAVGMIPARYPGSESSEDNRLRLSRQTEWLEYAPDSYRGLGQRMLATDSGEYSLMDVREIHLNVAEMPAPT
jgi:type VI secretion system protein ImpE